MIYSAEPVDLAAAEEMLAQLWPDSPPVQRNFGAKLKWYYLDNPDGNGLIFQLTCRNSVGGSEIVGMAGACPRAFAIRGKPLRAAQVVDFAIAKRHRTAFPALLLQRTVREQCKRDFDFLFGFPNRLSEPIFARLGHLKLGKMTRFVRVLRYEPYLRPCLHSRALATLAGGLLVAVSRAVETIRALRASAKLMLEAVQDVDARFDDLWEKAHHIFPVLAHRGASFLRWRFLERPGHPYSIFALTPRGSGEVRAYGVIQDSEGTAHLADLFGRTERDISLLLDLLIPEARRRGFGAISFHFLGANWIRQLLERHGFHLRYAAEPILIYPGDSLRLDDRILTNPQAWYFTTGDSDA